MDNYLLDKYNTAKLKSVWKIVFYFCNELNDFDWRN